MPIIVKRSDNEIIESSSSLPFDMKGKYEISYPSAFDPLDALGNSYVFPRDNNNVIKKIIEPKFTRSFPSYSGVIYNPLLELSDLDVDVNATLPDSNPLGVRFKSGEGGNLTALIGNNDSLGYDRNGLIITNTINIGALTSNLGSQTYMVYWKGVKKQYTQDTTPIPNVHTRNEPANLFYTEVGSDLLKVYISSDNGSTYSEVDNLVPFSFGQRETSIRLAFRNLSEDDVFLLSYAILY